MQTSVKSKRNVFIDYLKAITILTVVMGHCIQFGSGQYIYEKQIYFDIAIFRIIYSFHMPMFMLVSGYLFFNTVQKYSGKIVLLKKIQSICIPICFWGLVDFVISLSQIIEQPTMLELLKMLIESILSCLWFLWALLYSSIITLIIKTFGRDSKWLYISTLIFSFFITDSFHLRNTKFLFPFFVLGYFGNKGNITNQIEKMVNKLNFRKKLLFMVMAIFGFAVLIYGYSRDISIYRSSMCIRDFSDTGRIVFASLYRWLTALIGCEIFLIIIYSIYRISAGKLQDIMIKLSICSLGIYIINSYTNTYLLLPLTAKLSFNPCILLLETIFELLLCWSVSYSLQKIHILNMLMFGGR